MKEGRIFYQGPVSDMLPFYSEKGYSCHENYNPADFLMDLVQSEDSRSLEENGLFMDIPTKFERFHDISSMKFHQKDLKFRFESSFWKQLSELTYREVVNTVRDYHTLGVKFGLTIMMNLLYGLIFYQTGKIGNNSDPNKFNAHFGALMMIMMFSLFGTAQSVILTFPFERPMVLREYVTGTCKNFFNPFDCFILLTSCLFFVFVDGIKAYFMNKIAIQIPVVFIQMVFAFLLDYFLMDLQGNFIFLVLIGWGLGMVAVSVALCLGCVAPNVKDATELVPLAFLPQILFAGFFIRTSQIPAFMRWAQYLCGLKYAMNLSIMTEFRVTSPSCNTDDNARTNCENLLDVNDIHPKDFWLYIILLFVLFLFFTNVGALLLYEKGKRFY
jgi:hypothetical protein